MARKSVATKEEGRARTHRLGLPFHGSPLCVLLPLHVKPEDDGPTSLRRGEGHRVCLSSVVGEVARFRGGDGGGMKKDEPTINHRCG